MVFIFAELIYYFLRPRGHPNWERKSWIGPFLQTKSPQGKLQVNSVLTFCLACINSTSGYHRIRTTQITCGNKMQCEANLIKSTHVLLVRPVAEVQNI